MNNRNEWKIARVVIRVLLFALLIVGGMHFVTEEIASVEKRADSIAVKADGLRAERDSLLSVVRGMEGETPTPNRESVLWTTRAVLSETKRADEMLYIANIIRNRVDSGYRGATTPKQVVLSPFQFSAFNPGRQGRWRYINLTRSNSPDSLWQMAWRTSKHVLGMPRSALPLRDPCINHFFYPNVGRGPMPRWSDRMEQVDLGDVGPARVMFFKQTNTRCHG